MSSVEQIRIMCPSLTCRRILAVPASSRGKNVRCKNCGATIRVPDKVAVAPIGSAGAAKSEDDKSAKPAA